MSEDGRTPDAAFDLAACLALAVDSSGTGVWDRDIVSGRIAYSSAWKAMLGYTDEEIGNNITDSYTRVHPDDLERVRTTIQAHFDNHTPLYEVEHRLRCKSGDYIWVLSRGKVVSRNDQNEATRMTGVTTNISATVALSDKLRQSAQLLARLTDAVPGLVYQYSRPALGHAAFTYASAGITDIFGVAAELAASDAAHVEAVIHADDLGAWHATLDASAASLARWEFEFRVLLPGAGEHWRRAEARPSRSADGGTVWHGFVADITQHKRIERQLQEAAQTDFLTGLPNRRFIITRMEHELARIQRDPELASTVLMFDLDFFKAINDKHGHATGDEVLKHFSQLLLHELRRVDAAGRIGGEEFAVILSGADMQDACAFAERLRSRLAASPMPDGDGHIAVTVSIGISAMCGSDNGVADSLSRADSALYRAKQKGRDRIESA